ncbi:MAG TPA: hypothetical protein DDW27_06700 [Bacteroidales bacterium]|nr:hypothetical protein [Bacteroidales bacterium]
MSKRFDNKKLIIILSGLLLVLFLTYIFKIPRERSTLEGNLIDIDTSTVAEITITPKSVSEKPFTLIRKDGGWNIRRDDIVSVPMHGAVQNILSEIINIKPQSLAAVGEQRWKEYELTDSLATKVKLINRKGKELAGLMIGRFSYRQINSPYGGYGGNNIEGTTYVRLAGDDRIYAVPGFLAFSFSGGFNDYRDKTFVKCNKNDITKVTFTMPADSSFILMKRDTLWYAGNQKTDSAKTADYLSSLTIVDGRDFEDGFKPDSYPVYQMMIEGNNLLNITVKCFKGSSDQYILNSSLNPDVYYSSRRDGIFGELFKPLSYFF